MAYHILMVPMTVVIRAVILVLDAAISVLSTGILVLSMAFLAIAVLVKLRRCVTVTNPCDKGIFSKWGQAIAIKQVLQQQQVL